MSKNTLKNWLKKGKRYLDNLIKVLMKYKALEKDSILNCDETWCKVRRYNKYLKKYMWVLENKLEKIVIFFYDEESRGRKVLTDFWGESEVKAILTDGYNAYNFLYGTLSVDHLLCMAYALNYFDYFNEGLFMYRKDGRYPIDNNLAERQVRSFTALRKAIQHYGSDAGAEMAAVYLCVVSTVKLAGQSVWRFLGDFFEDMVTGGKKHLALLSLSTT